MHFFLLSKITHNKFGGPQDWRPRTGAHIAPAAASCIIAFLFYIIFNSNFEKYRSDFKFAKLYYYCLITRQLGLTAVWYGVCEQYPHDGTPKRRRTAR
jgi:hypothetical protein